MTSPWLPRLFLPKTWGGTISFQHVTWPDHVTSPTNQMTSPQATWPQGPCDTTTNRQATTVGVSSTIDRPLHAQLSPSTTFTHYQIQNHAWCENNCCTSQLLKILLLSPTLKCFHFTAPPSLRTLYLWAKRFLLQNIYILLWCDLFSWGPKIANT